MTRPIDILIQQADMRCAKCGAAQGTCTCWTRCRCGWHYEAGKECRNPCHKPQVKRGARFRTRSGAVVCAFHSDPRDEVQLPESVVFMQGFWRLACYYEKSHRWAGWCALSHLKAVNG